MSRVALLAELLRSRIKGKQTVMRSPVDVLRNAACTLYYLSDEGRLRKTANASDLSRQCVAKIIRGVCTAMTVFLRLLPNSLRMLTAEFQAFSCGFAFPCGRGYL